MARVLRLSPCIGATSQVRSRGSIHWALPSLEVTFLSRSNKLREAGLKAIDTQVRQCRALTFRNGSSNGNICRTAGSEVRDQESQQCFGMSSCSNILPEETCQPKGVQCRSEEPLGPSQTVGSGVFGHPQQAQGDDVVSDLNIDKPKRCANPLEFATGDFNLFDFRRDVEALVLSADSPPSPNDSTSLSGTESRNSTQFGTAEMAQEGPAGKIARKFQDKWFPRLTQAQLMQLPAADLLLLLGACTMPVFNISMECASAEKRLQTVVDSEQMSCLIRKATTVIISRPLDFLVPNKLTSG